MKILIIDTYYQRFLDSYWRANSELQKSSYHQQFEALISAKFGTSDYYSHYLNILGQNAWDVIANDKVTQQKWAAENNVKYHDSQFFDKLSSIPYAYRVIGRSSWVQQILLAQVKYFAPKVVYVQDLSILTPNSMKLIKKSGALLVGQIASPLPPRSQLAPFDLILTSFPHFVSKFKAMGIESEYFRIGFDKRLLKAIGKKKRIYDVSFVGSFSPHHHEGTKILEKLSQSTPINVWGVGLSPNSPLQKFYHGEAWGLKMYEVLAKSKIVINRHITVAKNYANNMRLYEATGMGALVITENKSNLRDLFRIDEEILSYSSTEELMKKVKYYLANDKKRQAIARAGQIRTLKSHTYNIRMQELIKILTRYL